MYISIQSRFDHKAIHGFQASSMCVCGLAKKKKRKKNTPNIICFMSPKLFDNCFDFLFSFTASFSFIYLSFEFDFGRIRTVFYSLDRLLYCCRCTYCVASHSINPWINTTFSNKNTYTNESVLRLALLNPNPKSSSTECWNAPKTSRERVGFSSRKQSQM